MAVTELDVRHVAALARIGLDDARVPALVAELNRILEHMEVLRRVKTAADVAPVAGVGAGGMPLRDDAGPQYPLAHPRSSFAPAMRAHLFLVPRLATHTAAEGGPTDGVADDAVDSSVDDAVAADALAAENAYVYDGAPRPEASS